MGYFFSQTWMWWLLAIVLAVAITWLIFRESHSAAAEAKREAKAAKNEVKAAKQHTKAVKEERRAAKLEGKLEAKAERHGVHAGNEFDAGYEGANLGGQAGRAEGEAGRLEGDYQGDRGQFRSEEERLAADADRNRTRVDGVQIPGQQEASLKERIEEKAEATVTKGRRKFF